MSNADGTPEPILDKVISFGIVFVCASLIITTFVVFLGLAIALCHSFLPLWGAILLGVPLGIAVFKLSMTGETALIEMAYKCLIFLILIAILIPVINRAKQNREKANALHQRTQLKPQ